MCVLSCAIAWGLAAPPASCAPRVLTVGLGRVFTSSSPIAGLPCSCITWCFVRAPRCPVSQSGLASSAGPPNPVASCRKCLAPQPAATLCSKLGFTTSSPFAHQVLINLPLPPSVSLPASPCSRADDNPEAWRRCLEPLKAGPGKAAIPRWYYDASQMKCVEFKWGGVQPNGNNFALKAACKATCKE